MGVPFPAVHWERVCKTKKIKWMEEVECSKLKVGRLKKKLGPTPPTIFVKD